MNNFTKDELHELYDGLSWKIDQTFANHFSTSHCWRESRSATTRATDSTNPVRSGLMMVMTRGTGMAEN